MTSIRTVLISNNPVYSDSSWSNTSPFQGRPSFAIGPDVVSYITDFVGVPVDPSTGELDTLYTITRVQTGSGSSVFVPIDGVGGIVRITTDDAENDGINAQLRGESFKLAAGNSLSYIVRAKIDDATQTDFFLGLAITDTDILGGVTDSIGFTKVDGSTALNAIVNKNSTATSVSVATADTSYHIYEFHFVGSESRVYFYIDGSEVARLTSNANVPDDEELRPSIHFLTGEAVAKNMDLDYLRVIQVGRN